MKKRIFLLILATSLLASNIPVHAEALEGISFFSEETTVLDEASLSELGDSVSINNMNGYRNEDSYWDEEESDEKLDQAGASNFPSSYDSRDYGYITVKKEQFYGTCWAFASIAAAEASIIKCGLANNTIDLSEYHLAYYMYQRNTDPLGNTSNDYSYVGGDSVYDILNYGGNLGDVAEQFAKWCGPVLESSMPGENAINLVKPSTDISFQSLFHLKKAVWGNSSNRDEIKDLICKYGAVASSYYVGPASYVNYEDYSEATYHFPTEVVANHSICIIGWNDNYPKENFNYQPEGNGAWLVKNHDGANQKYMWISYYTHLQDLVAFEFESAARLQNNYQYDGCPDTSWYLSDAFGSSAVTAKSCMNIFASKKSQKTLEKLETVMIHQKKNNTYQIQIYVNPVIKDGQLVSYEYKSNVFNHTADYGGIYMVEVSENIYLNEGDTFAVEISGGIINEYAVSTTTHSGRESMNPGECYVGKVEKGEFSYQDLSTYNYTGTPRIKAFTNATSIPLVTNMSIDVTQKELNPGESFTIKGTVDTSAGGLDGVSYVSSDPKVASVDASGKVTAVAPGTTTITVTSTYGNVKKTCTVNVRKILATSLDVETEVTMLVTETHQLKAVLDEKATDRNLSYLSSDETVAYVNSQGEIYGVLPGTATITVATTDGSNLVATCDVTVKISYEEEIVLQPITELLVVQATSYNIAVGGVSQLLVSRYPENVADSRLAYTISNPSVLSLNNGVIQGLAPGTATITVTALDSGISGSVCINVEEEEKQKPAEQVKVGTSFKVNNLYYTVTSSSTVKITGATKSNIKTLTVPSTVKYKKKTYRVTEVGSKAFYSYKKLKTVKIGKNVNKIGSKAFAECPIEKLTLPASLKEIESSAFKDCKSLKSVTMGSNVSKIGSKAFYGCKKLKTITIKSKCIKSVGKNAFKGIATGAKLTVPKSKYNTYKKTTFKNAGLNKSVVWKKK